MGSLIDEGWIGVFGSVLLCWSLIMFALGAHADGYCDKKGGVAMQDTHNKLPPLHCMREFI